MANSTLAEMEKPESQVLFEAYERARERLADARAAVIAETAAVENLRQAVEAMIGKLAPESTNQAPCGGSKCRRDRASLGGWLHDPKSEGCPYFGAT